MVSSGQYFETSPAAPSDERSVLVALPDLSLRLTTDRGVFSHGALDEGTKVLLTEAPLPPAGGALLDVGCGYGPIACALAARSPGAVVWAVDVNERARALCAANATANGLANVRVVAPEAVPADVAFDGIWSNPPIRIGKPALHALLLTWLGRLAPDGRAHLVVHKHLGSDSLAVWLGAQGFAVERRASRHGYRVLDVHR